MRNFSNNNTSGFSSKTGNNFHNAYGEELKCIHNSLTPAAAYLSSIAIQNGIKAYINRSQAALTFVFDFNCEMSGMCFLVRCFDSNGQYLNHFKTEFGICSESVDGTRTFKLMPNNNVLTYRINARDANYIKIVEFGCADEW